MKAIVLLLKFDLFCLLDQFGVKGQVKVDRLGWNPGLLAGVERVAVEFED